MKPPIQQLASAAAPFANCRPRQSQVSLLGLGVLAVLLVPAPAQVLTVDTSGKGPVATSGPVDRRYAQIEPTHVELAKAPLDTKTRLELERALQSEQGFANRPFPRGHKGLTLQANGKLEPAGAAYLNTVISEGLSAKPGARVVITDIKVERSKIIFDFDGGPDGKHRFLRHLQVNLGDPGLENPDIDPSMTNPNGEPAGARLTLAFSGPVPELTPVQVKALLAPLVSFDVKSPVQAFTDTLPAELKKTILDHKVLVGMTTDMVIFAKGLPGRKTREMDGDMPFEEWIYGTPPEEVDFVRVNGNRVIRVEISRDGEPLEVFTKDVVSPMMTTDENKALLAQATTRTVREGDADADPNKQAVSAPPTLRNPGEKLPDNAPGNNQGQMRPVQFPKPHPDDQPVAHAPGSNPDEQPSASAPAGQSKDAAYPQGQGSAAPDSNSQLPTNNPPSASSSPSGATGSQPQSAPPNKQQSPSTSHLTNRAASTQSN